MNVVVIGAGIVGLHAARVMREAGHEVFVLEMEPYLGEHTSGRNSGVIHSGVFYKTGSFKEKICIEGNRLTYEWLKKLQVPHRECGKWIVPEEGQENDLEPFFDRIRCLPIPKPLLKSADEVEQAEPHLRRTRAILVPSTGILNAATYLKKLAHYLELAGVSVILNCRITEVKQHTLVTTRGDMDFDLAINSAGLFCDDIARMAGLTQYTIKPCRGDYYVINKSPIQRPVYHLPYQGAHGLGVHLTPTVEGDLLIGPNAFFIDEKSDYRPHSDVAIYESSVKFYLPKWSYTGISLAYSGNRPKLYMDGEAHAEFKIISEANWIHLLGIESPGLTSAPALAEHLKLLI